MKSLLKFSHLYSLKYASDRNNKNGYANAGHEQEWIQIITWNNITHNIIWGHVIFSMHKTNDFRLMII